MYRCFNMFLVAALVVTGAAGEVSRADDAAPICTIEGDASQTKILRFAPGGILVTAGTDDTIRLLDTLNNGKVVRQFRHSRLSGLTSAVLSVQPEQKLIAARYRDGGVVLWSPKPMRLSLEEDVAPIAIFPDGKVLLVKELGSIPQVVDVSGSTPQTASVGGFWEFYNKFHNDYGRSFTGFTCCAVSSDGEWFALLAALDRPFDSEPAVLLLFRKDTRTGYQFAGQSMFLNNNIQGDIRSMAFVSGQNTLVTMTRWGHMNKYTIKKGDLICDSNIQLWNWNVPVFDIHVTADGKNILGVRQSPEGKLQAIRWNLDGAVLGRTREVESDLKSPSAIIAPDGSAFAVTALGDKLNVYKGPSAGLELEDEPAQENQSRNEGKASNVQAMNGIDAQPESAATSPASGSGAACEASQSEADRREELLRERMSLELVSIVLAQQEVDKCLRDAEDARAEAERTDSVVLKGAFEEQAREFRSQAEQYQQDIRDYRNRIAEIDALLQQLGN